MNDANQLASVLRSKGIGLAVALTSLLLIARVPLSETASSQQQQQASDNLHIRARVGHFAHYQVSDPLASIYKLHFDNVLKNSDSSLSSIDINDWRRARPSGQVCLDYLRQLRVYKLVLLKPSDIVIMDACLDWLFGDERHSDRAMDISKFSNTEKNILKQLQKANDLKEIYNNTKFKTREIPETLKNELYSYLAKLFEIHGENPQFGCHGEWLKTYVDFLEDVYMRDCDSLQDCKFYGFDEARQDSYLRMIADSTIEATKACYDTMLRHIGKQLKQAKEERTTSSNFATRLVKSAVSKQQEQEKWTHEMTRVLQMAQGVDKDTRVELGDVAVQLEKIKDGDDEAAATFTREVESYANENVDVENSGDDHNGRKRYGKTMADLCKPFVDYDEFLAVTGGHNTDDQKTGKPFDFYKIVYSLVRVTNHEELVGISSKQFEEDVIKNNWEAVYLATFACHVIFNSWGVIGTGQNELKYEVELTPEALAMLAMWPIEHMSEQLPILHPKSSSSSSSPSKVFSGTRPKKPKIFSGKLRPRFTHGKEEQHQAVEEHSENVQTKSSKPAAAAAAAESNDSKGILDNIDKYLEKYPKLVDCLQPNLKQQYQAFGSLGKIAYKVPVDPNCEF